MRAVEFCAEHNEKYVNYCEVVIDRDGDIQYATPSHQYKLMEFYGISQHDIWEMTPKYEELIHSIPQSANPTYYMAEEKCVCVVWYNSVVVPLGYTDEQVSAIKTLISNGCLYRSPSIVVSNEKSILDISQNNSSAEEYENLSTLRTETEEDLRRKIFA